MIDPSTVDQIRAAARITEVVQDFVTLHKRGVNYIGLCPFHNEKTPSFIVSPGKEIFKCFGCGKAGDSVKFVMEHEHLSYGDALRYLARKYNIPVEERTLTPEELAQRGERESMLSLNEFAQKTFATWLRVHEEGHAIGLSYFRERGFHDATIEKFGLGYALGKSDAFSGEARKNGFELKYMTATGLVIQREDGTLYDRFHGRVMFPIYSLSGKVIGFGGRVLKTSDHTAKYLNSPESEIYHKSDELYGLYQAKNAIVRMDLCYLVEGYTDVISMHQAGVENVVASSGTSLTTGQIRLIKRFTQNIVVLYDGDSAGIKASLRGIDMLLAEGLTIKVVLLPEGEDPDSYARGHEAADFVRYVEEHATDFIRFKTNLLMREAEADPVKRAQLITSVVRSISVIPDTIQRSVYAAECAKTLAISEDVIVGKIKEFLIHDKYERQKQTVREAQMREREAARAQGQNAATANTTPEGQASSDTPTPVSLTPPRAELQARDLVRDLVRYGGELLFIREFPDTDEETQRYTVARYLTEELRNDEVIGELYPDIFKNPVHRTILADAEAHARDEGWDAPRHYATHADMAVSALAADMLIDRYERSEIFAAQEEERMMQSETYRAEERLRAIRKEIIAYKVSLVNAHVAALEAKFGALGAEDFEGQLNLLGEIQRFLHIKNELSRTNGQIYQP